MSDLYKLFGGEPHRFGKPGPNKTGWLPEPGDKFMISRNKITGDRSFCSDVLECIAASLTHVQFDYTKDWHRVWQPIVLVDEHDFYPADGFAPTHPAEQADV